MELKNKKVLVTGAGGFIGSHLVESLVEKGCQVRAFVHYNSRNDWGNLEYLPLPIKNNIEVISGDIIDHLSVKNAVNGCDIVFHLAALIGIPYSYLAPQSYVNSNVIGTLNIMQASLDFAVQKVVHTSTSEVYGTSIYTPIDEKHPLQGQSPYSASKIGADKIVESFFLSFKLPVATLRPFNTYGPRQSARAVIPAILTQILSGKQKIHLGSLAPVRDLNYVKDTVEAFICICQSDRSLGETINAGTGKGISIQELVENIVQMIGRDVEIATDDKRVRPENSEVMELICDNTKAREIIGWQPRYKLKTGLKETIEFIGKYLDRYKSDIYNV
jgi:NAD dependent epimerase/dehydratase